MDSGSASPVKNGNLRIKGNKLSISVNPRLYPLEAVYSAAYVFMDKAYIILDGDPESEIIVNMELKSGGSLEEVGNEFNNELLNYSDYLSRAKETRDIRELILQRSLVTNNQGLSPSEQKGEEDFEDIEDLDDDYLDDPEGIAIPWEEKYGNSGDRGSEEQNEDTSQQ